MMRRYDLVTFDFDGTLADSAPWFIGVLGELADQFNFRKVEGDELSQLRKLPTRDILRQVGIPFWRLPAIARELRQRSGASSGEIPLFEGIPEVLAELHRNGVRIGIVSSNGEATVRAVLGPLADLVTRYECGSSLFGKARLISRLRRSLGIQASRSIHVGDEERDIEAARKAGVASGAILYGYADPDLLRSRRPGHYFSEAAQILSVVGHHPAP